LLSRRNCIKSAGNVVAAGSIPYCEHPAKNVQQEIGRKTSGAVANMPAQPIDIMRNLNRDLKERNGQEFAVQVDVFPTRGAARPPRRKKETLLHL
jgi:hypothetical protein